MIRFGLHLNRAQALGALSWLGSATRRPLVLADSLGPRRWSGWWALAAVLGAFLVLGCARGMR